MIRVISMNLNGIRSATSKGFFSWFKRQKAHFLCVQETKAQDHQIPPEAAPLNGFHHYFHNAEKKGYSGVGIYTAVEPDRVTKGLGWEDFDREGRYIQVDFGKLSVASIYMPSGTSGDERQRFKYDIMDRLRPLLRKMRQNGRRYILCGDWNIAHKNIDLKNWRGNMKNSGFLPEERAWMDDLFGPLGFVDGFRVVNQKEDQYTWWSNRGRAREKNVGWRIDYQVITPCLASAVKKTRVYKDKWFSDHAPLIMDYEIELAE